MKKYIVFVILIFSMNVEAQFYLDDNYYNSLKYSHDLNLPDWGPYTKRYIGISHIPDMHKGLRFDLSVFPGFYRRKVDVPNVFHESGYHPWEATPNLEYFSFRHELEWKDQVYTDISYSKIDSGARAIYIECVNNTNTKQSIVLHFMASVQFPPLEPVSQHNSIKISTISLPQNVQWIDAVDYLEYKRAIPDLRDELIHEGMMRGEIRNHGLINGSGVKINKTTGDQIKYRIDLKNKVETPYLYLRYKTKKNVTLQLSGIVEQILELPETDSFSTKIIPIPEFGEDENQLSITTISGGEIILDGFAVVPEKELESVKIQPVQWDHVPEIISGPIPNTVILKYKNIDQYYGIYWDYSDFEIREWHYKDLSDRFLRMVNNHYNKNFYDGSDGHFTNVFLRPININPNSTLPVYGMVCNGTIDEVRSRLKKITVNEIIHHTEKNRKHLYDYKIVPAGEKYLFSQKRMAATVMSNVVYPIYTQKQYIKHNGPGRWWDCLYTWDSGFIGIGLSQLDIQRGIENLNAYVNEPDEQSAFIHRGTPIPVQHYLYQEIWNKTQSEVFLRHYYQKLKKYYNFLAGHIESSTTDDLNSGLIRTWDYFYNTGWDDYPPQEHMHKKNMTGIVSPVVSTAHQIRIAKILQQAAMQLKIDEDITGYKKDIEKWGKALNKYSWDEETGYYGYVIHNDKKDPVGILKYKDSVNYNMAMGGAYPIISDVCDKNQTEKILSHLKSKDELWTDIGLSTVDQSAPYYSHEGYWNGTVWMPHQWFFWKAMLDIGEDDFAYKIANTALDVWKKETDRTYHCFEHFVIETGRGAGWHQFSGLSSIVLSWFSTYYEQGNITTGFNTWIIEKEFNKDISILNAKLQFLDNSNRKSTVIVCLNPNYSYNVYWDGRKIQHKEINKGTLSITLNDKANTGLLYISKQ